MVYASRTVLFPITPTPLRGHASLQGAAVLTMEKTQQRHASQAAQLDHLPIMPYIVVTPVL
jgi:hypothetical protein